MRKLVGAAMLVGAVTLTAVGAADAAGSSGSIIWSDDVTGTTTRTGSVFGTRCGSGSANAAEEGATLALINGWATDAVAAGYTYLSPVITPANNTTGDNVVLGFPGITGVTVTVSRRQVSSASAVDLADPGLGAFSPNARFRSSLRLQDCAPRPADLSTAPRE